MLWRQDKRFKEIPEGGGTAKGRTLQGFAFYMTYEEQLQHPLWIEKREEIKERDWNMCQVCMSSKDLQVHHKYYIDGKMAWEYPGSALITLCGKHHKEVHGDGYKVPVRKYSDPLEDAFESLANNFRCLQKAISKIKNNSNG